MKSYLSYFLLVPQLATCFSGSKPNVSRNTLVSNTTNNLPLKVSVIGSGSWGTVVSKIVAENTHKSKIFHPLVKMYVKEEIVDNDKLSNIINKKKENVKYMKGMKVPDNVLATSNLKDAVEGADLLIFVVPHQYLESVLNEIVKNENLKKDAKAISLMKGIKIDNCKPMLLSSVIEEKLNIGCAALSGSNIANELSTENFSESTIGFEDAQEAGIWQELFDRTYFKINCVEDKPGVETCGALKNVVALGVGFLDASSHSYNTKSAIIRIGLDEMKRFTRFFFPDVLDETFLDSCGLADLITTCLGGRNLKCAREFATRNGADTWDQIEMELLNGQKLQGIHTAKEVYSVLEHHKLKNEFPLFTTIYEIAFLHKNPSSIIDVLSTKKLRHIKYKG
ncbi:glycerol-3-phosphate dehydrogenase, putative [Plasmodium knowlesi strain H]|uniref:Glycerol-3-phosphate dehydrogenase [NAD(+)] n=3 Tax=Plasmodium knowlesi TaxID=5850 RepID=A0A5K1UPU8_PLAKH|nr:glycerol-3-phosphate dehydrogenase, putative [Plasmodium knowlesi strain H]OTN65157.1 Glycerol-3-phosphate dehydrogenase [NAD(+)] [Plasmodium knowlesi]CAA9988170.1 glycerol-3-phosphate dehydrogenase, putative [Plasmodium knowlesi strain H]SBO20078.1 glycerol-3-phosphate dehydrogenase, putative [Plasmodium knowlesi strain H]SBO20727.1 glycerol-3-phosphate dehydrogenase, putative [Plasmodium knowlesi strain H]VVS77644.1 glycerol-3-phosphate dehydrogenase, putative [Plasmodium knowlesi strain |eukprot:XP_002259146.1 glycerol-3-phosphate dehydrogenase, putative [Plasmodium knowlesi strain H]